ncbi:MAG: hypothetical protein JSV41_08790 [Gemmatimonadota bacterium]|nr:MAG: hypothetical protein JSV41_08790 [Gemmatimonadota bacterium]
MAEHYLYRLQATRPMMLSEGPTLEEVAVIEQHSAYLKALAEKGVVTFGGRTLNSDETAFGIVVLSGDSEDAARHIMENDPAVRDGVLRADLYPFRIAYVGKA